MSGFVREQTGTDPSVDERELDQERGSSSLAPSNAATAANAARVRARRQSSAGFGEEIAPALEGDPQDPEKFWAKYEKLQREAEKELAAVELRAFSAESATARFLANRLIRPWREVVRVASNAQGAFDDAEMDAADKAYQAALEVVRQVEAEGLLPEVQVLGYMSTDGKLGVRLEVTEGSTEQGEAEVLVEYSVDGGATFSPASMYHGTGSLSLVVGQVYEERWYSELDVSERPSGDVLFRATAIAQEGKGPSFTKSIPADSVVLVPPKKELAELPYEVVGELPELSTGDLEGEPVGDVAGAEQHPEAYAELLAFMSQSYTLERYDPQVEGLDFDDKKGLFDATYVPSQKLFIIDQRIRFQFGSDEIGWDSDEQKQTAKLEILRQIESFWQARHTFECAREPKSVWGSLGPIQVDIRLHEVDAGEHFSWKVDSSYLPSAGVASSSNSAFVTEPTIDPLTRGREFGPPGLEQSFGDPVPKLAAGELAIIQGQLAEPFEFVAGSTELTAASLERIETAAAYLGDVSDPRFSLDVRGGGPLGAERAEVVRGLLAEAGVDAHHEIITGGGGQADGVSVTAAVSSTIGMKYSVAHEAGHTFGLGDVYGHAQVGHSDEDGTRRAPHYELVKAAFGEEYADLAATQGDNKSMMGGGVDVRAYEYVTFWDALVQATSVAGFSADDWKFSGGGK